ncbi:MAG: MFS transporter [Pseudomonadota bacterium]
MTYPLALFFAAQACLTLALSMLSVAVGWHLYERTGDPFDLALVGLMQILPIASLFIVSGWVVDNVQRKHVLIVCAVLQAGVFLGLLTAIETDTFSRLGVFGLLLVMGIARAFYSPAGQAYLPGLVTDEKLSSAVALSHTIRTAGEAFGPFVAGLLIAWLDVGIYRVLGIMALVSATMYALLPSLPVHRLTGRALSQLLDGVRFIIKNPLVLPAISLDLFIVLFGSVMVLLPVYAVDILNVGPEALGLMRAMPAVGAVGAGVLLARYSNLRNVGRLLFVALALFAISILVFAISSNIVLSLVALFAYGATDMVSVNVRMTTVQLSTPDSLRGRVNSVNYFFIATSNDLGDFRAGSIAALFGPVGAAVAGGVMSLLIAVGGYFAFPTLRRLDRLTDAKQGRN